MAFIVNSYIRKRQVEAGEGNKAGEGPKGEKVRERVITGV